jgi:hypothetical protein
MNKRKVEFELDINKLAAWVAVAAPILGGLWWIWNAHETHELVEAMPPPPDLHSTESLVKQLAEGQLKLQQDEQLRQELWGESYRKKISSMVDEYDEQKQRNDLEQ